MSDELKRVSLTIPRNILDDLDEILESQDYSSRSEAVRDALRDFLANYRWREELSGPQRGVVIQVYDHHVRNLTGKLLEIQHNLRELITSVQHLHLGKGECMEAIIVEGRGERIRELVDKLRSLKGVKQVEIATVG
ncbi:hypothetical protein AKJ65_01765 [candidate division MSBL1 archaeon SCGC-AAA259E19]|uniref:Putative nickel-responsive regulator n=1 Tax=candidate division MSBL1 archaeon SCGC-AAA259E19 TaxID=1698264 RepID=A0A133UMW1_9EURY|nr:hypothetical protein AKJ65_01765 [candidate division MSBL1 archaeon SCGC-AAA259E19]